MSAGVLGNRGSSYRSTGRLTSPPRNGALAASLDPRKEESVIKKVRARYMLQAATADDDARTWHSHPVQQVISNDTTDNNRGMPIASNLFVAPRCHAWPMRLPSIGTPLKCGSPVRPESGVRLA